MFERIQKAVHDLCSIWGYELRQTFRDLGMIIFFLIVPMAYPLLYSYIYSKESVHNVPVLVVDNARTSTSRDYLRRVDATAEVEIVAYCSDMEEAKKQIRQREAYGIIYIPSDFSHNIHIGKQAHVSLYCDMSGLLYYKGIVLANTQVSLAMNKAIKLERSAGLTERQGEILTYPIEYQDIALYNPATGFATFLLPAVLVLIIQQTLLLGIGLSAGTARERNQHHDLIPITNKHYSGTLRIVLGKAFAYLTIYSLVLCYTLIVVPRLFNFVQLAELLDLALFALPYTLACIFFAMSLSIVVRHREVCMMIFVFSSVPLLFLSGVSWPATSIPDGWKLFSYLFPSTFGINAYIKLNSMGASLEGIQSEYTALWLQTIVYFVTTCLVYSWQLGVSRKSTQATATIAK